MSTVYQVNVTRDEDAWLVDVPQIERVTQALNLQEVDTMARDLIHIMTNEPLKDIKLDVHIELPEAAQACVTDANRERALAEETERQAKLKTGLAAKTLHEMGLTLRDIGKMLGISYQRVHQLVKA
ncbi:hypothetical protein [Bifidobacterium sp. ESL0745]|uniref:hypothetical protein n=1 Tax=Bifidobacterium sp. ESL0745 TaxID=2983226 RepID=UPI0023F8C21D|nr:hypothetical protein [Bifidobacterium sp. ESL0745]MDF7664887.1 hypothetical protein [Bifidobacterium sp. ESL0745]